MRNASIYIITPLLFFIWVALSSTQIAFYPTLISDLSITTGDWFKTAHLYSNAFHMWRVDHLVLSLCKILGNPEQHLQNLALVSSVLIFFSGLCFLLNFARPGQGALRVLLMSAITTTTLTALFGNNLVLFGAISWLPAFTAACLAMFKKPTLPGVIIFVFILVRVYYSANQLSLFILIAGFLLASFCSRQEGSRPSARLENLVLLLVFIVSALSLFHAPFPSFPDYPALSRVVPDDGIAGIIRPLIGADAPIVIINRSITKPIYLSFSLIALIFSCFLFVRERSLKSIFPALCFLLVIIDGAFPEAIAQIAPLETLRRVIPGLSVFSLSGLFVAIGIVGLMFITASKSTTLSVLSALLLLAATAPNALHYVKQDKVKALANASSPNKARLVSPSLNVYKELGLWLLDTPELVDTDNFLRLKKGQVKLLASHNNEERSLRRILDKSPSTRWSTKLGKQTGTEHLLIQFMEPTTFRGVRLNTGKYSADYPRGLNVFSCPEGLHSYPPSFKERGEELIDMPSWQGAVKFTSDGFPYFGSQADVKLIFDEPITTKCLLIEQIAENDNFEWSIVSIDLILKKNQTRI